MTLTCLFLLILLVAKHYIADIPLQTNWMALNKGTFLHPGGLIHAGIHGLASICAFIPVLLFGTGLPPKTLSVAITIIAVEIIVHYLIDFTKMSIDKRTGWSHAVFDDDKKLKGRMVTSNYYYWSLVGDQCLHFLTYILMAWFFLKPM